jgi:hypothetical protein
MLVPKNKNKKADDKEKEAEEEMRGAKNRRGKRRTFGCCWR